MLILPANVTGIIDQNKQGVIQIASGYGTSLDNGDSR